MSWLAIDRLQCIKETRHEHRPRSPEALCVTRRGAVLEVTLDHPKANAIDGATSRRMGEVFARFRDDFAPRAALSIRTRGCVSGARSGLVSLAVRSRMRPLRPEGETRPSGPRPEDAPRASANAPGAAARGRVDGGRT